MVRGAIVTAWLVFEIGFAVRFLRRGTVQRERRAAPRALAGVLLQAAAFFVLFVLGPRLPHSRLAIAGAPGVVLGLAAIALAGASVWLVFAALAHLGEQWSIRARLLERHALVTSGPYRFVRHPIYTGVLGLLIATGVGLGRWRGLALSVPLYVAGTLIRTRGEERLLREAFGDAYDAYAKRVRAVVPFVW